LAFKPVTTKLLCNVNLTEPRTSDQGLILGFSLAPTNGTFNITVRSVFYTWRDALVIQYATIFDQMAVTIAQAIERVEGSLIPYSDLINYRQVFQAVAVGDLGLAAKYAMQHDPQLSVFIPDLAAHASSRPGWGNVNQVLLSTLQAETDRGDSGQAYLTRLYGTYETQLTQMYAEVWDQLNSSTGYNLNSNFTTFFQSVVSLRQQLAMAAAGHLCSITTSTQQFEYLPTTRIAALVQVHAAAEYQPSDRAAFLWNFLQTPQGWIPEVLVPSYVTNGSYHREPCGVGYQAAHVLAALSQIIANTVNLNHLHGIAQEEQARLDQFFLGQYRTTINGSDIQVEEILTTSTASTVQVMINVELATGTTAPDWLGVDVSVVGPRYEGNRSSLLSQRVSYESALEGDYLVLDLPDVIIAQLGVFPRVTDPASALISPLVLELSIWSGGVCTAVALHAFPHSPTASWAIQRFQSAVPEAVVFRDLGLSAQIVTAQVVTYAPLIPDGYRWVS
jgi:hypothetical protein